MNHKALEKGEVSTPTIMLILAIFIMIGLVVDGGAKLTASTEATQIATEAGRTGAQQLQSLPTQNSFKIDTHKAKTAAQSYIKTAGATGTVKIINPTTLEVTTHVSKKTVFLGLIGIHNVSASHTARINLLSGQTEVIPQ